MPQLQNDFGLKSFLQHFFSDVLDKLQRKFDLMLAVSDRADGQLIIVLFAFFGESYSVGCMHMAGLKYFRGGTTSTDVAAVLKYFIAELSADILGGPEPICLILVYPYYAKIPV
jgi:hypothetical protein